MQAVEIVNYICTVAIIRTCMYKYMWIDYMFINIVKFSQNAEREHA